MPNNLQLIALAIVLLNFFGVMIAGPLFVLIGWSLNIPCGLFHYLVIEKPFDAGDPFGTAVICAVPWAQALLTTIVVAGALVLTLRRNLRA